MKHLIFTVALILLLPQIGATANKPLFTEDSSDKNAPLEVTSNRMISDNKNNNITFLGAVIAIKGKLKVESDKMVVHTDESQSDVKNIIATGSVVITRGYKVATGEKAEYFADGQKIVLTGNPVLKDCNDTALGERIIYFFDREDMVIVGGKKARSKVVIHPKNKNKKDCPEEEKEGNNSKNKE